MPLVIRRICLSEREKKREKEKEECSICGVTSKHQEGGRRGSGSTLKFQVKRLRGRTKGNLLTSDTSFIHTQSCTHSYSHAGWATALQQHSSGFCYILWLLICAKHIWCKLLFSVICCKKTLSFKWLNASFHEAMAIPKPAFIWYNYSDLEEFKFTVAGHPCKQNIIINLWQWFSKWSLPSIIEGSVIFFFCNWCWASMKTKYFH